MSESIYNLVPQEYYSPEKKPMYKSMRQSTKTIAPASTFGCHGTTRLLGAGRMDVKEGALYGPPKEEYGLKTKKATMDKKKEVDSMSGITKYSGPRRSGVPAKDDRPIMGISTNKNFVTANAVEAILQVPKPITKTEINYMKKEDFGKIPSYLSDVKEEIKRENEMIDRYVKEQMGEVEAPPEVYEEFPETEKQELMDALKAKWDNVNAKYQKITHLVKFDTTGQVRRKEQLEAELQQLENDIEKLHRSGNVLIRN